MFVARNRLFKTASNFGTKLIDLLTIEPLNL